MTQHFMQKTLQVLREIGRKIIQARQDKVNKMIARKMMCEYPNESYEYILYLVERGRLNELVR